MVTTAGEGDGVRRVEAADGRVLEVHEAGDHDGAPVLWFHGTPAGAEPFGPWVQDASERGIRLVGYDRPGYGGSTPHPGRAAGDAAADAEAVLNALGIERCVAWGISGGGPHVLAAAALLPARVAAAAVLGSVAPYDAEGLDWLADTGEANVEETHAALKGRGALDGFLDAHAGEVLDSTPEDLLEAWSTLLGAADRAVLTGDLARYMVATGLHAVGERLDGWRDDDLAFVAPWGFDVSTIQVPVLVLHGGDDRFVPAAHGRWLAEHVSTAKAALDDAEGHLTLYVGGVPRAHAWLLEHL